MVISYETTVAIVFAALNILVAMEDQLFLQMVVVLWERCLAAWAHHFIFSEHTRSDSNGAMASNQHIVFGTTSGCVYLCKVQIVWLEQCSVMSSCVMLYYDC